MRSYFVTDKGKTRDMNQDYIFSSDNPVGSLPNLYIVADGMGGYKAGDYASRCCVEEFVAQIKKSTQPTIVSKLSEALRVANTSIMSKAASNEEFLGMGTTFVAATIEDGRLYTMNVGDSRLYLIGQEIKQVTVDHSYVEELIRIGQLNRQDARLHPQKNTITRAVGVESAVEADFYETELDKEFDFILLCSDGLTNMIEDEEIRHIVMKRKENPQEAIAALIAKANENGGRDNISAVMVQIES